MITTLHNTHIIAHFSLDFLFIYTVHSFEKSLVKFSLLVNHFEWAMIYPTDFSGNNLSKSYEISNRKKLSNSSLPIFHILQNRFNDTSRKRKIYPRNLLDADEPTWIRYCDNTTIHGLRYLTDRKIQYTERYIRKKFFIRFAKYKSQFRP